MIETLISNELKSNVKIIKNNKTDEYIKLEEIEESLEKANSDILKSIKNILNEMQEKNIIDEDDVSFLFFNYINQKQNIKELKEEKEPKNKERNFLTILLDFSENILIYLILYKNIDISKIYLSLTYVTEQEIKEVNNENRNINDVTDVLSFPMYDKEELEEIGEDIRYSFKENKTKDKEENKKDKPKNNENKDDDEQEYVLGDILVCLQRVIKQAEEYKTGYVREFSYMLVHSFLHLLGYDHINKEDKVLMRDKEEEIMTKLFN